MRIRFEPLGAGVVLAQVGEREWWIETYPALPKYSPGTFVVSEIIGLDGRPNVRAGRRELGRASSIEEAKALVRKAAHGTPRGTGS